MKRPELLVLKGLLAGQRFAVGAGGLRLGRSSSNDVCIRDEELSRNHCLFDPVGENGISVTDLASANGTFVNGDSIGSRARDLIVGDVISVGGSQIRVVPVEDRAAEGAGARSGEAAHGTSEDADFDLGLGTAAQAPAPEASGEPVGAGAKQDAQADRRRRLLWRVTGIVAAIAALVFFFGDTLGSWLQRGSSAPSAPASASVAPLAALGPDDVREMSYEKVSGDSEAVFRYAMTFGADGVLKVVIDDTSDAGRRHVVKSQKLKSPAFARLREILADPAFAGLDRDYSGPEGDPPVLDSRRLKVIYASRVKDVSVLNTSEPEEFRRVREKLEAFTKNELGVWAIQYSRERLVELAAASAEDGRVKWDDREVERGNVYAAVRAYREAVFYLDSVNPKPAEYEKYRMALKRAEQDLERRYREQRFCADRAINLADWETAKEELQILCEMVPDRDDERYREASAKLVDVETRLSRKGGTR